MLFSGHVTNYRCTACGHETQTQQTTSFLYWLFLLATSLAVPAPVVKHYYRHHAPGTLPLGGISLGGTLLLILLGSVILIAVVSFLATLWVNRLAAPGGRCPKCAGLLKWTSSGFYDFALIPAAADLLAGLAFLLADTSLIVLLVRK